MNPFFEPHESIPDTLMDWQKLYPRPYDKATADPYTRTRVILMNGTEFEACWFSHQFSRHCADNDLRRELAMLRRVEQQQQKLISALKPLDETILEHTIGYEQLAVDLTAALAQREPNAHVKAALDFALLEDFDHLYRYADLLEMRCGERAEHLVGHYTEIMPGRPTIAHHRCPADSIRTSISPADALETKLCVNVITAAEQQTMNYYMNVCALPQDDLSRRLYQEIGMIEEQHVSHYGSLLDPSQTWLECLLMHQYAEAYLYWSCMETESDLRIRQIWETLMRQEIAHVHKAAELLRRYEGKDWQAVLGSGEFPAPLRLTSNIAYVRGVLADTVQNTALREGYAPVETLSADSSFFAYQQTVNRDVESVPSHRVIEDFILARGEDYRFETAPNPIEVLRNRRRDNTSVGRECTPVMAR